MEPEVRRIRVDNTDRIADLDQGPCQEHDRCALARAALAQDSDLATGQALVGFNAHGLGGVSLKGPYRNRPLGLLSFCRSAKIPVF